MRCVRRCPDQLCGPPSWDGDTGTDSQQRPRQARQRCAGPGPEGEVRGAPPHQAGRLCPNAGLGCSGPVGPVSGLDQGCGHHPEEPHCVLPPVLRRVVGDAGPGAPSLGPCMHVRRRRRTLAGRGAPAFRRSEPGEIEERHGLLVTGRVRTALDLAAFESFEQGVTVFDHLLRPRPGPLAPLTKAELDAGVGGHYTAAAARRIRAALEFADGASGSPGESVSRAMMHRLGFRVPLLQVEIRDARGLVAYTDFDWPGERLCGEFDGVEKYRNPEYLRGRTPEQSLVDEKLREDRIRATGRRVVRWTWATLSSPQRFASFLAESGVPRATLPSCQR